MELIDNQLVVDVYRNRNYKIEYNENGTENLATIYFSSNGLYNPNQEDVFRQTVVEKDRYEWTKNKNSKARKHIFVRDIFKQWYVKGINSELNRIEKVLEFLKSEVDGYRVITVGSSAGGYAAVLFGSLLKADYVLAFAAQFTLYPEIDKSDATNNQFLYEFLNDSTVSKFYDLSKVITNSNVPIYYFCPSRSEVDEPQLKKALSINNVRTFLINSKRHGVPVTLPCLTKLINMNYNQLNSIYEMYKNKEINNIWFSYKISGLIPNVRFAYNLFQSKINSSNQSK